MTPLNPIQKLLDMTNAIRNLTRREFGSDFEILRYDRHLARIYHSQVNVERASGGEADAKLIKFPFKPPWKHNMQLGIKMRFEANRTAQQSSRKSSFPRDNINNDLRLYMQNGINGAVEALLELFQFRKVKVSPTVCPHTIYSEKVM